MKILGIESSCDETAAAVVEDGERLLSNVVNSQIDIHAAYGGVIPEVAARSHIEVIGPVVDEALERAECEWDDIDAIAVTYAPGLVGSLLIGTLAARTLAIIHEKPLYAIHHVEAHVYANFIISESRSDGISEDKLHSREESSTVVSSESAELAPTGATVGLKQSSIRDDTPVSDSRLVKISSDTPPSLVLPSKQPEFPMLALIVSGGHSQLVLFKGHGDYELLGQTQDDAVGEAFDKVAKILGLPYPGGPSIAKAALLGSPQKYTFPKAKMANPYDFSFSGLKTAVLRAVQAECGKDYTFPSHELSGLLSDVQRNDFAASFQRTAVQTLVDKTAKAFEDRGAKSVVIAGGVAANQELRRQLSEKLPISIEYAPMQLCTDNAAMIASLGYFYSQGKAPSDPYSLEVVPSISMTKTAWNVHES